MKRRIRLFSILWMLLDFALTGASRAEPGSGLSFTPTTLPAMTTNSPWSVSFVASGGVAPYTWSALALPPGLALNSATGVVSGTPASAGSYVLFLKVTDSQNVSTQHGWNVTVAPGSTGSGGGGSSGGSGSAPVYTVVVNGGTINGGAASTGSFAAGATITITANAAPAGQWFKQWSGNVAVANSTSATTTFTMPSASVVETAQYFTPPTLVQPVTTHPRLWVTPNDLPRLRSWANAGNPTYQQGLRNALTTALTAYSKCFPNGTTPASPYPDTGDTTGYSGATIATNWTTNQADLVSEQHALVLAFFALIDNDPNARVQYAQKAKQLLMVEMNEAVKGHAPGLPFRDPMFAIFNRSNGNGEAWPLIVDWLQGVTDANGQPVAIFNSQELRTIRDVFMIWANDCVNAYVCGGDHPAPIGTVNSTALLPSGNAHRVAVNNYYGNHARLITMMPLCIDPVDDPPVNPNAPAGLIGNTLRSYINDATGAWLYQQFAMYGDPATVRSTFGLGANSSVGLSSGGLPVEGGLYGHCYAYVLGELLALQTAGFNDPNLSGPQIGLIGAPMWDRFVKGFLSQMVNSAAISPLASYLGPVYQMASYGDLQRLYITPDFMQAFSLLALLEQQQGQSTHLNEARWVATNGVQGGAANFYKRINTPWNMTESILYFLLFDPTAAPPSDPRPAYSTVFYDAGQARLLRRTNWSPQATMFTYRAAPASINHVNPDAGQFEIWRNGEFLTKELSNYDNYGVGQCSMWHNTLTLKNWCVAGTPYLQYFEASYFLNGGGWNNGMSAGDPVSVHSDSANYSYVQSDLTKEYNRPGNVSSPQYACNDILHASRSILYLNNDFVVVYDRAASLHAGLFKRFNLNMTTTPMISGGNVVEMTPKLQKLFVRTLLPQTATTSWVPVAGGVSPIAELEPTTGRIVVEDMSNPTSVRFLHVLQAGDPASSQVPSKLVRNNAGSAFDGAQFGDTLVMFANDITVPFAGVTYSTDASATTHYVTGLTPNAGYNVAEQVDALGNVQITITSGGSSITDAGGVLVFNP